MLCTNGHNNADSAKFCSTCGVNTFHPMTSAVQQVVVTPSTAVSTNGLAIASMVLGIVWIYWVGSALALIFGFIARKQIKESGQKGDGMAIAGIVLGCVGAATLLLFIIFGVIISHSTHCWGTGSAPYCY